MEEEIIESPDLARENRVPPGQRATRRFPTLHEGRTPSIDVVSWRLRIWGKVEEERELTYEEFLGLGRVKVRSDIHCVTGWSRLDNLWEGVPSSAIKEAVEILPQAQAVMVHCEGRYTTNLLLDDFFQPDVLFAITHDGKELASKHGHPVRLVVPRLYLWKSAKWVNGLEFISGDKPGFWESRGYHMRGDPWKEERYSHR
jgi:DMSO/TMAO reductase YedYZ molybdopterin-dependent catalytic subunit